LVSAGEGKGWAKGKTAATDSRISRAAEAHRGMTYSRCLPPQLDRRHRDAGVRTLALEWSPTMAYVVGLMATDGCLISDGRHLNFKSGDEQLVQTFLSCLGRRPAYGQRTGATGSAHYVAQFSDVHLWRWLRSIGVGPRKSLVLGAIGVPSGLLLDCARGLLDGDGSIIHYWYDGGGKARGRRYEAIVTRFVSASGEHIAWLRTALHQATGVTGHVTPPGGNGCWYLDFAIRESAILLPHLYPSLNAPCLLRKRLIWQRYAAQHGLRATLDEIAEAHAP
jgi:hypothetical protein